MNHRKLVHISMSLFALLIGRFSNTLITISCIIAFISNIIIFPKFGRLFEDEKDKKLGFPVGILTYPAILTIISVIFFQRQIFLSIGWGMLAFGDGFCGLLAHKWSYFYNNYKLPWNPNKSLSGMLFFFFFGFSLTTLLVFLLPPEIRLFLYPNLRYFHWIITIFITSIICAFVETIPNFFDDNLVVPLTGSFASFLIMEFLDHGKFQTENSFMIGFLVVVVFGVLSYFSKKIDFIGTVVGSIIAMLMYLGGGFASLNLLIIFFVGGSLATQWKISEKRKMEVAEKKKGKRTFSHALCNAGTAAMCGFLACAFPEKKMFFLTMLAGSMSSAMGDTLSSELGNLYGSHFWNILNFRNDKRGLDGVVSPEGSLAGVFGSFLIAFVFSFGFRNQLDNVFLAFFKVFLAGIVGNITDSVLGASLQRIGLMSNHSVNLANTIVGALMVSLF
ncbi:transmembrane protein [Anaeramoeba ignava]|uniref:Transmembrane protein n=1 Tax=Anaeramoeba ignava TaxID=1746090 RepID=A0A9Q0LMN6_ANAIG|nr:transmembrane protein [Anaeramoeba ignava]